MNSKHLKVKAMDNKKKSKEELNTMREAQKRLTWIENVKRIKNLTQEGAEKAWAKIFLI